VERRLAAILAADVAGYTALIGADEAGTLVRLTDLRKDFLEPLIDGQHGRVVKLMGDGILVEFASVVDAVACAVAWQAGAAERDDGLKFRISINLGDLIVEGSDIYGDGVDVAARLKAFADPGGICISGPAFETIEGKIDLAFEDISEQQLKTIAKPERVYRLASSGPQEGRPRDLTNPLPLTDKPSIAVLPINNSSDDQEQEYLPDGIGADIITERSKISKLFVVVRNSTLTYKGRAVDKATVMIGFVLILAATLFPFEFSLDESRSFSNRFGLSRTIEARGNELIIGADPVFGQLFTGKIDELRIDRRALTPLEVAREANRAPGVDRRVPTGSPGASFEDGHLEEPAASYSFNETSGSLARDDSGHGNDGELVNGPEWVGGDNRRALSFNGTNQYVRVRDDPSINVAGQSLTISMWIAIQDSSWDQVIVGKSWHSGLMEYPYYQYGIEFDGSDTKTIDFYFGDTSGRLRGPFSVTTPIGVWTHVAFVYDGVVRGYVDGAQQLVTGISEPWEFHDLLGNLLLFIPFGVGLASLLRGRGLPRFTVILVVLLIGAVVSVGVEILQCWLPSRHPSLRDVATNSASSVLGAALYFAVVARRTVPVSLREDRKGGRSL
jgi:class 3 adenylate cyclase/VanZ family protein